MSGEGPEGPCMPSDYSAALKTGLNIVSSKASKSTLSGMPIFKRALSIPTTLLITIGPSASSTIETL